MSASPVGMRNAATHDKNKMSVIEKFPFVFSVIAK